jgi:glycosyl transferase family 1
VLGLFDIHALPTYFVSSTHIIKSRLTAIAFYITGHGYGHAVRSYQVIRALMKAAPDFQIHVCTSAPDWLFQDPSTSVIYRQAKIDVGIIQKDSLAMDLSETLHSNRNLLANASSLIATELAFLRHHRIRLILSDIPPLAFEIAAEAHIPSVAITNFTWSWIYRSYLQQYPAFLPLIEAMEVFYRKASLALSLPYACDMSAFPYTEAIPWVTRTSSLSKGEARSKFALPQSAVLVLLSFGGLGLERLPWKKLSHLEEFYFIATGQTPGHAVNLSVLPEVQRHYCDLLRAVDVIIAKPGYGIVADIIAHQIPVLYVERDDFPESPFLIRALNELTTAELLPLEDLLNGNLEPHLARLLRRERNSSLFALNGAEVAAEKIVPLTVAASS